MEYGDCCSHGFADLLCVKSSKTNGEFSDVRSAAFEDP